jgi:hypothetical protein
MRPIRLALVLTAAATLGGLAPAGALARPNAATPKAPSGPCRLQLEVPPVIAVGESVTIFGNLVCPTGEVVGRQVAIYERAASRSGFVLVGDATTVATSQANTGAFALSPPAFEVNSVFYAISQGAKSAHRMIRVAPVVTPTTPSTPVDGAQLFTGGGRAHRLQNAVTFTGKVSPIAAGALVGLQRENATASEEWHRIAPLGKVDRNGEYSITHVFSVPGDASIRVVVHPRNRLNVGAASSPASYEISQAENPQLTIESLSDPLIWGHSTTLKGLVKGAATGTHLTLLARPRGGQFTPVATTETINAEGAYAFPVAPLQNTLYKVTDATTSSAALFEGVKYALTVASVPSSAAVTQPVEFSGTVLPLLVGHRVYLERQGSLKLGWRVIDIGEVTTPANPGEGAPFKIVHAFNSPGPARLRIKIPGDPGNQGAASAAFETTVTPTSAALLKPEAPGRLPVEGQL